MYLQAAFASCEGDPVQLYNNPIKLLGPLLMGLDRIELREVFGKPPWSKSELKKVPLLFDRTISDEQVPRSSTPPPGDDEMEDLASAPVFHGMLHCYATRTFTLHLLFTDATQEGMWLFDARIASLRKTYSFIIKIELHRDLEVAGKHEGKVLADVDAPSHPLLESTPPDVLVEYRKNGEHLVEKMPVTSLRPAKMRNGVRLAIIKGDRVGQDVIHAKTDLDSVRVYIEGTNRKKDGFYVPLSNLCIIE